LEQKKLNGGEKQDGRQGYIFQSSVKFDANQLKLWIWRERYIKKISLKSFFFQNFKMAD
jgi:hypothetical protein